MPDDARPLEVPIDLIGGEGFPAMHYARKRPTFLLLDDDMNMVWHDTPSQHAVPVAIEEEQCVLD